MADEYGPDIVSVTDEEGIEHTFEELDRIETDDARYVALTPIDDADAVVNSNGEMIVLRVIEEDGETFLEPIEDIEELNEIGEIFMERLKDEFDFDENEE